jgi:hypothetical protein
MTFNGCHTTWDLLSESERGVTHVEDIRRELCRLSRDHACSFWSKIGAGSRCYRGYEAAQVLEALAVEVNW